MTADERAPRLPAVADSARLARGSVVAAWGLGITLAGHGLAGGPLPSLPALVPLALVSLAVGAVVAGRRIGFARALAALLLVQPVLHLLLHAIGHAHGTVPVTPAVTAGQVAPAMLAGHVGAALGAAAWLAWADAWLWRTVRRLAPPGVPADTACPVAPVGPRLGPAAPRHWGSRLPGRPVGSRAPPVPGSPVTA
jgi:hypothetical protein